MYWINNRCANSERQTERPNPLRAPLSSNPADTRWISMDNSTQVVHSLRIRWNSELCVQGCNNADLAAGVRQARVPGGEGP